MYSFVSNFLFIYFISIFKNKGPFFLVICSEKFFKTRGRSILFPNWEGMLLFFLSVSVFFFPPTDQRISIVVQRETRVYKFVVFFVSCGRLLNFFFFSGVYVCSRQKHKQNLLPSIFFFFRNNFYFFFSHPLKIYDFRKRRVSLFGSALFLLVLVDSPMTRRQRKNKRVCLLVMT